MLTIEEASKELGVCKATLRRWEREGKISSVRTQGGHRRYITLTLNDKNSDSNKITIGYCRVSTYGQKEDLNRQKQIVELYCASKGYQYEIIEDIGSGLNYNKQGLKRIIKLITENKIDRIIVTHRDRLIRFGYEMLTYLCQLHNVTLEIINTDNEKPDDNQELVKDVLEIITVFSAKLYGKRSHKNKKLLEESKKIFTN